LCGVHLTSFVWNAQSMFLLRAIQVCRMTNYKLVKMCAASTMLRTGTPVSANLYLRSTVDTALEIWQQLSSERD
jgi:hypothetical protein